MIRALFTAATGMEAQQLNIDTIAHNLANANTTGFKRGRADFQDLLYQTVTAPGTASSASTEVPSGLQIGLGVKPAAVAKIFAQGDFRNTGGELDLGVEGDGFFQVVQPNGEIAYTRAGTFKRDSTGQIVTSNGYPLEPAITLPTDTTSVTVAADGTVSVLQGGSATTTVLGTIDLIKQLKGEIVGLLGPNGAGKTTTVKIVAGILAPTAGTVSVCGLPLPEQSLGVKQRIGYVPEAAALFESLTGQEFLELSGRLQDVNEDSLQTRIESILETFDLSSDRVSSLDTYSKGMRQKILIAAALLHNPDLVLLDEPLSGLDVNASIMIKELLAALASEGKTILYSSHILDVVEQVCDRVLIIHEGDLIADGTMESLRATTQQARLEDIFRTLTDSANVAPAISRVIAALRS